MTFIKSLFSFLLLWFQSLLVKPYKKLIAHDLSLSEIGKVIKDKIGTDFLLEVDQLHIAGKALGAIGFEYSEDKVVIANNCRKVIAHKISVARVGDDNVIDIFHEHVLGIVELPVVVFSRLILQAQEDLQIVNTLIDKYEQLPFVQDMNSGKINQGRAHSEYTIDIFYKRAKTKAANISEYIKNGAKDIAITHSGRFYVDQRTRGISYPQLEKHMESPYLDNVIRNGKLDFEVDIEAIDYEKISRYKNKMFVFSFMNDIRTTPPAVLDQEILNGIDPEKVMSEISTELLQIPLLNKRKEIFEQLLRMVREKLWYGFYALAIPQVEGIVAELLDIAGQNKGTLKALPKKVKALRAVAPNGEFDMDYYEFYLPDSRNIFTHTGMDTDIIIKSFHLLLDLKHLLHTAAGLENSLIMLNNIANDSVMGINHIGDLVKMIRLVKQERHHGQFKEVKEKLDVFVYVDIINTFDLPYLLVELSKFFTKNLKQFESMLEIGAFLGKEEPINFINLSNAETKNRMGVIQKAIKQNFFDESYKVILDIHIFVSQFPKFFDELPQEIMRSFSSFAFEHAAIWPKMKMLANADSSDLSDDYLVDKKMMMKMMDSARK
ncbi:hypothetical protein [Pedobacter psychroterrae]|uniref:Uncharacterized protein n=1 Tax=Pedobacter psychroterrae TaxID=2530453 RepID=A0A4R0NJI3_9SPHI|nr:hypothetical protein [Pedobacter psychroterrae]TCC99977.1 hypothetical protein EZ437_17205 [Pedobacter psychroterrae]